MFINVQAMVNNMPTKKKGLREALRDAPDTVSFIGTSMLPGTPGYRTRLTVADVTESVTLVVSGPDPLGGKPNAWYANVTRTAKGIKFS